uniref:Transposase n=1 Tax=Leptospirillum ferriphilum TaxID=178606 RepID=A0A7C3R4F9_9BACT
MESEKAEETGKKKRWTVEEKARIVRRYLKEHVGLADLAEETGSSPGLILQWAKQALEGLEQTFSKETHRQRKVLPREILEKEDRIRKLESVVSELSTENLTLKKAWGPLTGTHVAPETTEEVLKTVLFLRKTAGFPVKKSLEVLGLPSRTYHRWVVTQGRERVRKAFSPRDTGFSRRSGRRSWPSRENIPPSGPSACLS